MSQKTSDNLINPERTNSKNCKVCRDLLAHMERFIDMLQSIRKSDASEWLTVDDIAKELKVSKTIVYRLIRNGELEAVNIVENNGKIAEKGHYRIQRSSLNQYLEAKKVRPFPSKSVRSSRPKGFPKVKNHLGL